MRMMIFGGGSIPLPPPPPQAQTDQWANEIYTSVARQAGTNPGILASQTSIETAIKTQMQQLVNANLVPLNPDGTVTQQAKDMLAAAGIIAETRLATTPLPMPHHLIDPGAVDADNQQAGAMMVSTILGIAGDQTTPLADRITMDQLLIDSSYMQSLGGTSPQLLGQIEIDAQSEMASGQMDPNSAGTLLTVVPDSTYAKSLSTTDQNYLNNLIGDGGIVNTTSKSGTGDAQSYEQALLNQYYANTGDQPIQYYGSTQLDNLVGQYFFQKPNNTPTTAQQKNDAANGQFPLYNQSSLSKISPITSQILKAGGQYGQVSALPVVFKSYDSGKSSEHILFRVTNPDNGTVTYVDDSGRTYNSISDFVGDNKYGLGTTYAPTDGGMTIGSDGNVQIQSHYDSPGFLDYKEWSGDVVAGLAVVGAAVLTVSSFGVAMPALLVTSAWAVTVAGGIYMVDQGTSDLIDRSEHGQSWTPGSGTWGDYLQIVGGLTSIVPGANALAKAGAGAEVLTDVANTTSLAGRTASTLKSVSNATEFANSPYWRLGNVIFNGANAGYTIDQLASNWNHLSGWQQIQSIFGAAMSLGFAVHDGVNLTRDAVSVVRLRSGQQPEIPGLGTNQIQAVIQKVGSDGGYYLSNESTWIDLNKVIQMNSDGTFSKPGEGQAMNSSGSMVPAEPSTPEPSTGSAAPSRPVIATEPGGTTPALESGPVFRALEPAASNPSALPAVRQPGSGAADPDAPAAILPAAALAGAAGIQSMTGSASAAGIPVAGTPIAGTPVSQLPATSFQDQSHSVASPLAPVPSSGDVATSEIATPDTPTEIVIQLNTAAPDSAPTNPVTIDADRVQAFSSSDQQYVTDTLQNVLVQGGAVKITGSQNAVEALVQQIAPDFVVQISDSAEMQETSDESDEIRAVQSAAEAARAVLDDLDPTALAAARPSSPGAIEAVDPIGTEDTEGPGARARRAAFFRTVSDLADLATEATVPEEDEFPAISADGNTATTPKPSEDQVERWNKLVGGSDDENSVAPVDEDDDSNTQPIESPDGEPDEPQIGKAPIIGDINGKPVFGVRGGALDEPPASWNAEPEEPQRLNRNAGHTKLLLHYGTRPVDTIFPDASLELVSHDNEWWGHVTDPTRGVGSAAMRERNAIEAIRGTLSRGYTVVLSGRPDMVASVASELGAMRVRLSDGTIELSSGRNLKIAGPRDVEAFLKAAAQDSEGGDTAILNPDALARIKAIGDEQWDELFNRRHPARLYRADGEPETDLEKHLRQDAAKWKRIEAFVNPDTGDAPVGYKKNGDPIWPMKGSALDEPFDPSRLTYEYRESDDNGLMIGGLDESGKLVLEVHYTKPEILTDSNPEILTASRSIPVDDLQIYPRDMEYLSPFDAAKQAVKLLNDHMIVPGKSFILGLFDGIRQIPPMETDGSTNPLYAKVAAQLAARLNRSIKLQSPRKAATENGRSLEIFAVELNPLAEQSDFGISPDYNFEYTVDYYINGDAEIFGYSPGEDVTVFVRMPRSVFESGQNIDLETVNFTNLSCVSASDDEVAELLAGLMRAYNITPTGAISFSPIIDTATESDFDAGGVPELSRLGVISELVGQKLGRNITSQRFELLLDENGNFIKQLKVELAPPIEAGEPFGTSLEPPAGPQSSSAADHVPNEPMNDAVSHTTALTLSDGSEIEARLPNWWGSRPIPSPDDIWLEPGRPPSETELRNNPKHFQLAQDSDTGEYFILPVMGGGASLPGEGSEASNIDGPETPPAGSTEPDQASKMEAAPPQTPLPHMSSPDFIIAAGETENLPSLLDTGAKGLGFLNEESSDQPQQSPEPGTPSSTMPWQGGKAVVGSDGNIVSFTPLSRGGNQPSADPTSFLLPGQGGTSFVNVPIHSMTIPDAGAMESPGEPPKGLPGQETQSSTPTDGEVRRSFLDPDSLGAIKGKFRMPRTGAILPETPLAGESGEPVPSVPAIQPVPATASGQGEGQEPAGGDALEEQEQEAQSSAPTGSVTGRDFFRSGSVKGRFRVPRAGSDPSETSEATGEAEVPAPTMQLSPAATSEHGEGQEQGSGGEPANNSPVPVMTDKEFRALSAKEISKLSADDFLAIPLKIFAQISPDQIPGLTEKHISNFTAGHVAAFKTKHWRVFTGKQVRAISPELIPAISPGRIANMPPDPFAAMTRQHLANLTPEQAAKVTPDQLAHLSNRQLGMFPKNNVEFQPKQEARLSPDQQNAIHRIGDGFKTWSIRVVCRYAPFFAAQTALYEILPHGWYTTVEAVGFFLRGVGFAGFVAKPDVLADPTTRAGRLWRFGTAATYVFSGVGHFKGEIHPSGGKFAVILGNFGNGANDYGFGVRHGGRALKPEDKLGITIFGRTLPRLTKYKPTVFEGILANVGMTIGDGVFLWPAWTSSGASSGPGPLNILDITTNAVFFVSGLHLSIAELYDEYQYFKTGVNPNTSDLSKRWIKFSMWAIVAGFVGTAVGAIWGEFESDKKKSALPSVKPQPGSSPTSGNTTIPTIPRNHPIRQQLVVIPENGLNLRVMADPGLSGRIITVFRSGTLITQTGAPITDSTGKQWVPVQGFGVNDAISQGWVMASYVQPHSAGAETAQGRVDPRLAQLGYKAVVVQPGETMGSIASQYHLSVAEVVKLNLPHIVQPGQIFPGDVIYLPAA